MTAPAWVFVLAVDLVLPLTRHDGTAARCSTCRRPCQGTLRGVGAWTPHDDDGGPYAYQEGPVLCDACHVREWGAYRQRCAARRALWAVRPLGAGRTRVERDGEQLTMWGGK